MHKSGTVQYMSDSEGSWVLMILSADFLASHGSICPLSSSSCSYSPTSFLFQSKSVKMSFLFDWIYRGFSSILQFLGEYFCGLAAI